MSQNKRKIGVIGPASVADILGGPKPKQVGVMVYNHKTAGELQMMSAADLKRHRRVTDYKGYRSCLQFDKEEDIIREQCE